VYTFLPNKQAVTYRILLERLLAYLTDLGLRQNLYIWQTIFVSVSLVLKLLLFIHLFI